MKRLGRWLTGWITPLTKALAPLYQAGRASGRGMLLRPFQFLGRAVGRGFWAVVTWCAGLNLRLLLQALPALIAVLTCATVVALAAFTPKQDLELRYLERAQSAMKAKEYSEALLCYERLANLHEDRADILYEMALAAQAAEQPERCLHLMQQLAPSERQGYPKAHLWLAARFLSMPQTVQGRQLAETHLLRALEGGVEDKEAAHGLLGEIYLTRGAFEQAEPHLLLAAKSRPQVRLRLAHLYAMQGNLERARTEAKAVINLFSTAAKADLFAHYARLRWAEAVAFLEDFPLAIHILQEGLTGTGAAFYRPALAQTYAGWFDHLGRSGKDTLAQRMQVLELGLRHDPKNLALLDRLLIVAGVKHVPQVTLPLVVGMVGVACAAPGCPAASFWIAGSRSETAGAGALLRRLLAEGLATGQVHFALGMEAWQRGAAKEARFHWERALQLNPDMPSVANNLAWLLLQTAPTELNKALDLINLAIEKAPSEINFRDTRGHILVKMGKDRDALKDLEAVLPFSSNVAALHRTLADVYTRLEQPALAAEHLRLAAEKSAKKKT